jgi:putative membrane protein
MSNLIISFLVTALTIFLVGKIIPGIEIEHFFAAVIATIVLALVNVTLKPILFVLTLPINILTLGLFSFVLNAFFFYFVSRLVDGFEVHGFWPALFGSLIVSIIYSAVNAKK